MFKVGDEVQIKGKVVAIEIERCGLPYWVGVSNGMGYWLSEADITDKTYEQGLADAWELARKIYDMKCDTVEEIFGARGGFYGVIDGLSCEEALAKIEVYEKEKSEIKVGDVVEFYYETEEPKEKGVVTWVLENGVAVVWVSGETEHCKKTELTKTGKHIDIESLLRQIGE